MTFRADDGKTSRLLDFGRELDIRTTARHVGGDGHGALLTGLGHNRSLLLVQLGVQYLVLDLAQLQHLGQQFRDLDRSRTNQHRASLSHHVFDFLDHGSIFLLLGAVYAVVHIVADHRTVGRDLDYFQLVDVVELTGFGHGRTGHTGQLAIHAEIVLQRDGGVGLRGGLDLHAFLGLDGLMQTVAVAASLHDSARLLVDNLDLVVVDHIFHILVEQGVGLQQLVHRVYALRFDAVVLQQLVFLLLLLLMGKVLVLDFAQLRGDVGQDEEIGVAGGACQHLDTLVGQLDGVVLLVDHEVEGLNGLGHFAVVVLHVLGLDLEQQVLDAVLAEVTDQRAMLGQSLVNAEQCQATLFGLAFADLLLSFEQELLGQLALGVDHLLDVGLELVEHLVVALGDRT